MKKKKITTEKKKAWKAFSDYIRTRDSLATTKDIENCVCVTCQRKFPYAEIQAGHAIGGRNNAILFDEELVNGQCRGCNGFGNGKYAEYSMWFINKYGLKKWEEKVILSKTIVKYTVNDYQEICNKYKNKLKELKEQL